jgi:hypothetical protein
MASGAVCIRLCRRHAEREVEMNTCKSCKHRDGNGYCTSPKIDEDYGYDGENDMLVYSYTEGGAFRVGDNFGCVHHEFRDGTK